MKTTCTSCLHDICVLCSNKYNFQKYSQNWRSYQGCNNRCPNASFGLFHVLEGSNCLTSNFKGTSNIRKKYFFPTIFFAFFINKCGRYSDIDDSKRLVPEIPHEFMGTILRLISFGKPILVLKTVLNNKICKYGSVAKTTISTEFVEFHWYGSSKKWSKEWWSKFEFGLKKKN